MEPSALRPLDRRLFLWFALFCGVGAILSTWHSSSVKGLSLWPWLQLFVVALAASAMVASTPPARRVIAAAYWCVAISAIVACWVSNHELAALDRPFPTFSSFRNALLVAGLMLPTDLAVSVPIVVAVGLAPVVEWWSWPADWRARQMVGEPGTTLVVAFISLALLIFRTRSNALRLRAARAEAEAAALQELARVALAIRDLVNTPLQTLAAGLGMMKVQPPEPAQVDRLLRSLQRLAELNELLQPHAARVRWKAGDESVDSKTVLQQIEPPSM